jgi:hypothetical protein
LFCWLVEVEVFDWLLWEGESGLLLFLELI